MLNGRLSLFPFGGVGKRNNSDGGTLFPSQCEQEAHHGMSLPILVHPLFVMKNPTMGSVTAPQALPMNSTMEAWKALICREGKLQSKLTNPFITITQHALVQLLVLSYPSDIQQVDLQEEGGGAGGHLLGRAADGETQFTA